MNTGDSSAPSTPAALDPTRLRLLEAAGEVFAELGFHRATIRDICARAGANVAAVNYHFGDKERLYAEVLKWTYGCAFEKYPPFMDVPADAPSDRRLRVFVWSFLMRLLDKGRPAWHGKLMSREMAEPTGALDLLVSDHIRPNFVLISEVVRELLGKGATEASVRLGVHSVIGQCLFYHFGQPIIQRLQGKATMEARDIDALADHITQMTVGGLRQVAAARGKKGGSR